MEEMDSSQSGGAGGKGLVKAYLWMSYGQGQWCGDWLEDLGVGWVEEGKGGKTGITVIEKTIIKSFKNIKILYNTYAYRYMHV